MYTNEQRNKHFWIIAILSVIIFAITSIFNRGAVNLAGEYVDQKRVNSATLTTIVFIIPITGFFLGTLVTLIPYKGLTYKQKYLRSSLLTIIVIDAIMLANTVFRNFLY